MKKNLQKKDSQLQSNFEIGEHVVSMIDSVYLTKGEIYKVRTVTRMKDLVSYGVFGTPLHINDYAERFFIKATELNKALL